MRDLLLFCIAVLSGVVAIGATFTSGQLLQLADTAPQPTDPTTVPLVIAAMVASVTLVLGGLAVAAWAARSMS